MDEPERRSRTPLSISVLFRRRHRKTSGVPTTSLLAIEIVEEILWNLATFSSGVSSVSDQRDLGAASRVCRTWHAAATPHLYRAVHLNITACVGFYATLNRNHTLRSLVHGIHFIGSTETYHVFSVNAFVPLRQPTCALGASDDGMYDLFAGILDVCPHVREVHLPLPSGANFPESLYPPLSETNHALQKLEVSASGDDAHLDNGDIALSDVVINALKHPALARLEDLTLTAFSLRTRAPPDLRPWEHGAKLPQLKTLRLRSNLPLATQNDAAIRNFVIAFRYSLRAVEISVCREISVIQALEPVFSSLHCLTFYPANLHLNTFNQFESLTILSMSLRPSEILKPSHLPSGIRHLTLRYDYRPWPVAQGACASIACVSGVMPQLRTIEIRAPCRECDVWTWQLVAFMFSETAKKCGVRVFTNVQIVMDAGKWPRSRSASPATRGASKALRSIVSRAQKLFLDHQHQHDIFGQPHTLPSM